MIKETLRQCGYPEAVVVVDVETYFDADYSLSKFTNYEYVTDRRFEVLGWAVRCESGPAYFTDEPTGIDWDKCTVIMHNAFFDALILTHHYGIEPRYIIDTLDLSRHVEARRKNSLAALADTYGLQAKGDTKEFLGLHKADLTDEKQNALAGYACNDADITLRLFQILLPMLTNPKFELALADYTRQAFLNPVLRLNVEKADRLAEQMQAEVDRALAEADITLTQSRSKKHFQTLLTEALGHEPPMKRGKAEEIMAIAKADPAHEQLLNHENPRVRALMGARVAAKSWPLHQKRIGRLKTVANCCKGRLPIPLRYYGCHTGRWSGTQGINLHNLPARGHPLVNKIRTLIEAPPGQTLVILDFAQIEARVLAWVAGQTDLVRKFAAGEEVYCEFASKLIRHRVRKPRPTDSKIVSEWHNYYRGFGKVGILGCGFGMGAERLQKYARDVFGLDLTLAEAKRVVKLYRTENPMVVLAWKKIERAFKQVVKGIVAEFCPLPGIFVRREPGKAVMIELPSGRRLYYLDARITVSGQHEQLVMPDFKHGGKLHMWGGYLIENLVQAIARDILAEAIFRVQELGFAVPLTVHDDMAVVVPQDQAEECLPQIIVAVTTPPKWATGLPIAVEARISKEYSKG